MITDKMRMALLDARANEIAEEMQRNAADLRQQFHEARLLTMVLVDLLGYDVPILTSGCYVVDGLRFHVDSIDSYGGCRWCVTITLNVPGESDLFARFPAWFVESLDASWPLGLVASDNTGLAIQVARCLSDFAAEREKRRAQTLQRVWSYFHLAATKTLQAEEAKRLYEERLKQEQAAQKAYEAQNQARQAERKEREAQQLAEQGIVDLDAETWQAVNWLEAVIALIRAGDDLDQKARHVLETAKFVLSAHTDAYND